MLTQLLLFHATLAGSKEGMLELGAGITELVLWNGIGEKLHGPLENGAKRKPKPQYVVATEMGVNPGIGFEREKS